MTIYILVNEDNDLGTDIKPFYYTSKDAANRQADLLNGGRWIGWSVMELEKSDKDSIL